MKNIERIARAINPVAWLVEGMKEQRDESLRAAHRALEVMRGGTETYFDYLPGASEKVWKNLSSTEVCQHFVDDWIKN